MGSRLRVAAAAVVALLFAAPAARAQADDDPSAMSVEARTHLELGLAHYRAKDYEAAIREFRAGFAIDPRPELLFAMAQAERLSGDCISALSGYRMFLDSNPPEAQAAAARAAIEKCEVALGEAARRLDAGRAAQPPTAAPAGDDTGPAATQAVAADPRAGSDEIGRPWYRDPIGAGLLGAGVVSAAVGVGFYVASASDEAAAEDAATYGEYADAIDRAERRRTIAWVGLTAGAGLATGAAVYYWLRKDERRGPRRDVAFTSDGSGAAFVVTAEF
jgi:tetratricopeptide (TPR) repeat protein